MLRILCRCHHPPTMVKNDQEAVKHMLTSDGTFQSLRGAVFDGQEWLATGEFEDLLHQLEVQRQAHLDDKAENEKRMELLSQDIAALNESVQLKASEFQAMQDKYGNKQKLDRRIADLERTRRVPLNGKQIVGLLNQTRRRELENIDVLHREVAELRASSEALAAQMQHRTELFESLATQISDFRGIVEAMDPDRKEKPSGN